MKRNGKKKVLQEPRGTPVHIYRFEIERFLFKVCGVVSMVSRCL